jgi:hypothetical protein
MRINSFTYTDHINNWSFGPIDFDMLTLLVGISGVGKSHILSCIKSVADIVRGDSPGLTGAEWDLSFEHDNSTFFWHGVYEHDDNSKTAKTFDDYLKEAPPALLSESLTRDGQAIFEKKNNTVYLDGNTYTGLAPHLSVFNIFTESPGIKHARAALSGIYLIRYSNQSEYFVPTIFAEEIEGLNYNLSEEDRLTAPTYFSASIPGIKRLAITFILNKPLFDEIKREFIEVFPSVTDIKFMAGLGGEFFVLCIKEEGTNWIPQNEMSSGMYKTLLHISELKLSYGNSVILIDEFENSLGINCIDIMSDYIVHDDKNMQFIITSHHPYIINVIPMDSWKIVLRKGSVISTKNASELNIGKSSHEAFKQLMNNRDFLEGIK